MDLNDAFGTLIFLSLFEIIGGAAIGVAIRGLLRRDTMLVFFLIWGAGFGGIPFLIGALTFLAKGQTIYFYAQAFVFLTAIVTVGLLPNDFLRVQGETTGAESGAILGAIMTMLGGAVVLFTIREGLSIGLLIGGFFALLGAFILVRTTITIVRSL